MEKYNELFIPCQYITLLSNSQLLGVEEGDRLLGMSCPKITHKARNQLTTTQENYLDVI